MNSVTYTGDVRPKYEQAKVALLARIARTQAGVKLPSVQALREELGMSHGTIMRAINDLVEDGVIERRANRGAFVARSAQKANNILVVWPDLVEQVTEKPLSIHPSTSRILHSVQEAAERSNKNILITRRLALENPQFDLSDNQISGVLVLFNYDRAFVEAFVRRQVPVVMIDPLVRVRGVPFVMKDHCENIREATLSLVKMGHQRILYCSIDRHFEIPSPHPSEGIATYVIEERIRGYELAMRESGLRSNIHVHHCRAQEWSENDKDELIGTLRRTHSTACSCFNDDIAARTLNLCLERGISVPGDFSIIGHDDAEIARAIQPGLTTIQPPLVEMGAQAVGLLNHHIETRSTEGRGIILPSRLIMRASVREI